MILDMDIHNFTHIWLAFYKQSSPDQLKTLSAGSFPTSIFSVQASKIHISDLNKSLYMLKDNIYS